jgi:WD40 repeat protein
LLVSSVSGELERICLKAIAKSASERYASMRELAEDLRRFLEGAGGARPDGNVLWGHPEDKSPIRRSSASGPVTLRLRATLEGHTDRIGNLAWSFNGRRIATPSDDGTVRIWDFETGRCEKVLGPFPAEVGSVSWTRNGRKLAIGCADHRVYVVLSDEERPCLTIAGHTAVIRGVSWSTGGDFLATASDDSSVRLWNGEDGTCCSKSDLRSRVTSVSFSNVALLASTDEGMLHFLLTSPRYSGVRQIGYGNILHAAWSADDRLVAAGSSDTAAYVWDVRRREVTLTLSGHQDMVGGVSFSPDGRYLATKSSRDRVVKLWELATQRVLAEIEEIGDPRIYLWHSSLAFHPSLPVLATLGAGDRVVRIWQVDS